MSSLQDAYAPNAHQLPCHRARRSHFQRASAAAGHADRLAVSAGHVHHCVGHPEQPRRRRRDVDRPVAWFDARGVEVGVCVGVVVSALRVPLVPLHGALPLFARLFSSFFPSCFGFDLVFECYASRECWGRCAFSDILQGSLGFRIRSLFVIRVKHGLSDKPVGDSSLSTFSAFFSGPSQVWAFIRSHRQVSLPCVP
jgi:hypothetical protein